MLLIYRNDTLFYNTKIKKIRQRIWIFAVYDKSIQQIRKKLSDPTTKTELNAAKAASRKAVNKTTEATGELIGKKIAEKIVKTKPVPDRNLRNVEQIVLSTEKRQEILNKLRSWSTFKKQKL